MKVLLQKRRLEPLFLHLKSLALILQVHGLRKKIYQDAPPKCLHGEPLDGIMLGHLTVNYADAINNGTALNIGDAWSQVRQSYMRRELN